VSTLFSKQHHKIIELPKLLKMLAVLLQFFKLFTSKLTLPFCHYRVGSLLNIRIVDTGLYFWSFKISCRIINKLLLYDETTMPQTNHTC